MKIQALRTAEFSFENHRPILSSYHLIACSTGVAALKVQQSIEAKVAEALAPVHLDVKNESHMHSVPPGSESHFKLVIVSNKFDGLTRVKRHQTVNGILEKELREDIHALSMETLTTEEWEKRHGRTFDSPACLGGSKADAS